MHVPPWTSFNVIYWSTQHNKGTDPLKFKILLIQGLTGTDAIPHSVYGCSSMEPPPATPTERHFPERGHKQDVSRAQKMDNKEIQFTGAVDVKQNCVRMGVS
jgi:hypothetical protein